MFDHSKLSPEDKALATHACNLSRHAYLSLQPVPTLENIVILVNGNADLQVVAVLDASLPGFDEIIDNAPLPLLRDVIRRVKDTKSSGLLRVVINLENGSHRIIAGLRTSVHEGHSA